MENVARELMTVSSPQDASLTRWQETTEDLILELEHDMRGEYWDENDDKWKPQPNIEPRVKEQGIRELMSEIRARLNKVAFLSNIDEEDVVEIVFTLHIELLKKCCYYQIEWGISTVDINPLVNMITDLVELGLKKAVDEGERLAITNAQKRIERTGPGEQSMSPGFWEKFKGTVRRR